MLEREVALDRFHPIQGDSINRVKGFQAILLVEYLPSFMVRRHNPVISCRVPQVWPCGDKLPAVLC